MGAVDSKGGGGTGPLVEEDDEDEVGTSLLITWGVTVRVFGVTF